jgi:phage-related protein
MSGMLKLAYISKTSIPLFLAGGATYLIVRIFYKMVYEESGITRDVAAVIVTLFFAVAFYQLGAYIEQFGIAAFDVSMFVESGFLQLLISGAGLAAIMEMIRRVLESREEGQ